MIDPVLKEDPRLFNRQFLLTSVDGFPFDWPSVRIGEYTLFHHPNLELTVLEGPDYRCCLLGYIFDWQYPDRTNEQIVRHICSSDDGSLIYKRESACSGQYVIIISNKSGTRVYPDTCSQREIYYDDACTAIGSQPKILETVIEGRRDENDQAVEFYNSDKFLTKKNFPGNRTDRVNIFHLRPNHYIDLAARSVVRYFPVEEIKTLDTGFIVQSVIERLKGFIKAASGRYELKLGLTAGYDSRVLFLCSLDVPVNVYTSRNNSEGNSIDIRIAKRLASIHKVPHEIHGNSESGITSDARFLQDASIDFPVYRPLGKDSGTGSLVVNGNISEIARSYYGDTGEVTGAALAKLAGFEGKKYAIEIYDQWLNENREVFSRLGYHILDMFYWEEKMANWKAKTKTSGGLTHESYSPFNSRELLVILLGSDKSERDAYLNRLYDTIIHTLSPKAARVPVNPGLKTNIIRFMKRVGIYDAYKKLRMRS